MKAADLGFGWKTGLEVVLGVAWEARWTTASDLPGFLRESSVFKARASKDCSVGLIQGFKPGGQACCWQTKGNPLGLLSPRPITNTFTVNCCLFCSRSEAAGLMNLDFWALAKKPLWSCEMGKKGNPAWLWLKHYRHLLPLIVWGGQNSTKTLMIAFYSVVVLMWKGPLALRSTFPGCVWASGFRVRKFWISLLVYHLVDWVRLTSPICSLLICKGTVKITPTWDHFTDEMIPCSSDGQHIAGESQLQLEIESLWVRSQPWWSVCLASDKCSDATLGCH